MPLPIPDIMERAGSALVQAKKIVNLFGDKPELATLKDALSKVSAEDLLAVVSEVGKVYAGMHNQQILGFGAKPGSKPETIDFCVQIEFGLGPRLLTLNIPFDGAKNLADIISQSIAETNAVDVAGAGKLLIV